MTWGSSVVIEISPGVDGFHLSMAQVYQLSRPSAINFSTKIPQSGADYGSTEVLSPLNWSKQLCRNLPLMVPAICATMNENLSIVIGARL